MKNNEFKKGLDSDVGGKLRQGRKAEGRRVVREHRKRGLEAFRQGPPIHVTSFFITLILDLKIRKSQRLVCSSAFWTSLG